MTKYIATVRHRGINRPRQVDCGSDPSRACEIAEREFADGFLDHEMIIYAVRDDRVPEIFAWRRVGDEQWTLEP
jgi:hypothetical protein